MGRNPVAWCYSITLEFYLEAISRSSDKCWGMGNLKDHPTTPMASSINALASFFLTSLVLSLSLCEKLSFLKHLQWPWSIMISSFLAQTISCFCTDNDTVEGHWHDWKMVKYYLVVKCSYEYGCTAKDFLLITICRRLHKLTVACCALF